MRFPPVLALCASVTLLLASPALGAQRFAAPAAAGAMNCTSAANACTFVSAMGAAGAGDEIVLAGGTYPAIGSAVSQVASNLTIRPADPAVRPLLQFTTNGQLRLFVATLRDIDMTSTGSNGVAPLYDSGGGTIERVRITSTGSLATGAELYSTTMRDSTIVVSGTNARGIWTSPSGAVVNSQLRNLTVLASGTNSRGLDLGNNAAGGSTSVVVSNVIARATGPADVYAHAVAGAPVSIQIDHSSFATVATTGGAVISDGGGNQNDTAPVFVDQAAGDLREAPGSPTINAGADNAANGTLDVASSPRTVGTTDIGAHEHFPAPVLGAPVGATPTATTATVTVPVDPGGLSTAVHLDFGPTAAYGTSTPAQDAGAGVGSGDRAFSVEGLSPATTYHAQVVAISAGGTTTSSDVAFTTPAAPVVVPPVGDGTPTPPVALPVAATLLTAAARIGARRSVTLQLSCPATAAGGCAGTLMLSSGRLRLAKTYAQAAGTTLELSVRLSKKFVARVRSGRGHRRAVIARTATGAVKRKLTLRAAVARSASGRD
ncbi:MAG: hypothetical protein ACJ762_09925 [Solirubrobacteraceae bacterium]